MLTPQKIMLNHIVGAAFVFMAACASSVSGDWHKYDGVAYPDSVKEGTFKSIGKGALRSLGVGIQTLPDKVRDEAVSSGKEFLPSPEDIQRAILNPAAASAS